MRSTFNPLKGLRGIRLSNRARDIILFVLKGCKTHNNQIAPTLFW